MALIPYTGEIPPKGWIRERFVSIPLMNEANGDIIGTAMGLGYTLRGYGPLPSSIIIAPFGGEPFKIRRIGEYGIRVAGNDNP